ncbi:MAG: histidinol-phosphate transaminase [Halobacteriales archaeon]
MQPRDLSDHVAYEAGGGVEEVARELGVDPADLIKLASNENPLGPSPAAVEAIREHAGSVDAYPKAAATDLRAALADHWEVDPAQVWLGNGGDGVLDTVSRALLEPGDGVLVPDPGFAYYGMSARYHHGEVTEYRLSKADDFAYVAEQVLDAYDGERIVHLTTPHNPTGAELSLADVERIAEETAKETLVAVDEAYGEFTDRESAVSLVADRDDVAVVRTFSKVYGLAGLRLGYGIVPAEWADAYAYVNTPFSAGELSARAGLAALDDREHVERTVAVVEWAREYLADAVDAPTYPSGGNFVLVDVADADAGEYDTPAAAVAEEMQRRGVIVRDCTSFGLPGSIRVTCGTEEETRTAVEVLNEVLAER